MDRRRFICTAAGGVALALTSSGCDAGATYETGALARADLVAALGADTVRGIGTHYRAMSPAERDVESLRAAIVASRPWTARVPGLRQPSPEELVHSDFDRGRTVLVQGWILSATEARQCALYSLLHA